MSEAEKHALVFGHCSDIEFTASIELAARKLKANIANDNNWLKAKRALISNSLNLDHVEYKLKDKRIFSILHKLGKNENLYISKQDKGNGVVILDRNDYIDKMGHILSDNNKFMYVDDDCYKLTQKLESRLNKSLNSNTGSFELLLT